MIRFGSVFQHGTLLGDEFANLRHWLHAVNKRQIAFLTGKRGYGRQKPCIATIKVYSEYSEKGLSLDVQIELRADIAPRDCSEHCESIQRRYNSQPFICFVKSAVQITPFRQDNRVGYKGGQDAGLSYSGGVLWLKEVNGNANITIMVKNWKKKTGRMTGFVEESSIGVNWKVLLKDPSPSPCGIDLKGFLVGFVFPCKRNGVSLDTT